MRYNYNSLIYNSLFTLALHIWVSPWAGMFGPFRAIGLKPRVTQK